MIVFVQLAQPQELDTALDCALRYNASYNVAYIGDREYSKKARFIPVDTLGEDWKKFPKVYKHHTPNSANFELFCHQRWFLIRDLCRKETVLRLFHADSDVLICSNPFMEPHTTGVDYTLGWKQELKECSQVFVTPTVLEAYCDFCWKEFEEGKSPWIQFGSSDMSAWTAFFNTHPQFKCGNMNQILDGCRFQHNRKDIQMDGKYEKVEIESKVPYCFTLAGEKIRLCTLHCWFYGKWERMGAWNQMLSA